MRYALKVFPLAIMSMFLACATVPRTSIYTIDIQYEEKAMKASAQEPALAVRVRSPRYLQQPYIAERTSPYKLDLSPYSRWDRPPDRLLADALRETFFRTGRFREVEIYNSPPEDYYTVDATLRNFELSGEEDSAYALLSLDVTLSSPGGGELYSGSFSKKSKLGERSFRDLAEELSLALDEALRSAREGAIGVME